MSSTKSSLKSSSSLPTYTTSTGGVISHRAPIESESESESGSARPLTNTTTSVEAQEQLTACAVCGEGGNEDLILLCDSENCGNEVHMYCLNPALFSVPEGDWFCPTCCKASVVRAIDDLLTSYDARIQRHRDLLVASFKHSAVTKTQQDYQRERASILQQAIIPFQSWMTHHVKCMTTTFRPFKSEFDSASPSLIGCLVRIHNHSRRAAEFVEYHSGRILASRLTCAVHSEYSSEMCPTSVCPYRCRYEHLVYFKSGCEGRNSSYHRWICLDEVPCAVATAVVSAHVSGYPWWPALLLRRSGMDLFEAACNSELYLRNFTDDVSDDFLDRQQSSLYFYGNESYCVMEVAEARSSIVPLDKRKQDLKASLPKKLAIAFALATSELEERLLVVRGNRLFPQHSPEIQIDSGVRIIDGYCINDLVRLTAEIGNEDQLRVLSGTYSNLLKNVYEFTRTRRKVAPTAYVDCKLPSGPAVVDAGSDIRREVELTMQDLIRKLLKRENEVVLNNDSDSMVIVQPEALECLAMKSDTNLMAENEECRKDPAEDVLVNSLSGIVEGPIPGNMRICEKDFTILDAWYLIDECKASSQLRDLVHGTLIKPSVGMGVAAVVDTVELTLIHRDGRSKGLGWNRPSRSLSHFSLTNSIRSIYQTVEEQQAREWQRMKLEIWHMYCEEEAAHDFARELSRLERAEAARLKREDAAREKIRLTEEAIYAERLAQERREQEEERRLQRDLAKKDKQAVVEITTTLGFQRKSPRLQQPAAAAMVLDVEEEVPCEPRAPGKHLPFLSSMETHLMTAMGNDYVDDTDNGPEEHRNVVVASDQPIGVPKKGRKNVFKTILGDVVMAAPPRLKKRRSEQQAKLFESSTADPMSIVHTENESEIAFVHEAVTNSSSREELEIAASNFTASSTEEIKATYRLEAASKLLSEIPNKIAWRGRVVRFLLYDGDILGRVLGFSGGMNSTLNCWVNVRTLEYGISNAKPNELQIVDRIICAGNASLLDKLAIFEKIEQSMYEADSVEPRSTQLQHQPGKSDDDLIDINYWPHDDGVIEATKGPIPACDLSEAEHQHMGLSYSIEDREDSVTAMQDFGIGSGDFGEFDMADGLSYFWLKDQTNEEDIIGDNGDPPESKDPDGNDEIDTWADGFSDESVGLQIQHAEEKFELQHQRHQKERMVGDMKQSASIQETTKKKDRPQLGKPSEPAIKLIDLTELSKTRLPSVRRIGLQQITSGDSFNTSRSSLVNKPAGQLPPLTRKPIMRSNVLIGTKELPKLVSQTNNDNDKARQQPSSQSHSNSHSHSHSHLQPSKALPKPDKIITMVLDNGEVVTVIDNRDSDNDDSDEVLPVDFELENVEVAPMPLATTTATKGSHGGNQINRAHLQNINSSWKDAGPNQQQNAAVVSTQRDSQSSNPTFSTDEPIHGVRSSRGIGIDTNHWQGEAPLLSLNCQEAQDSEWSHDHHTVSRLVGQQRSRFSPLINDDTLKPFNNRDRDAGQFTNWKRNATNDSRPVREIKRGRALRVNASMESSTDHYGYNDERQSGSDNHLSGLQHRWNQMAHGSNEVLAAPTLSPLHPSATVIAPSLATEDAHTNHLASRIESFFNDALFNPLHNATLPLTHHINDAAQTIPESNPPRAIAPTLSAPFIAEGSLNVDNMIVPGLGELLAHHQGEHHQYTTTLSAPIMPLLSKEHRSDLSDIGCNGDQWCSVAESNSRQEQHGRHAPTQFSSIPVTFTAPSFSSDHNRNSNNNYRPISEQQAFDEIDSTESTKRYNQRFQALLERRGSSRVFYCPLCMTANKNIKKCLFHVTKMHSKNYNDAVVLILDKFEKDQETNAMLESGQTPFIADLHQRPLEATMPLSHHIPMPLSHVALAEPVAVATIAPAITIAGISGISVGSRQSAVIPPVIADSMAMLPSYLPSESAYVEHYSHPSEAPKVMVKTTNSIVENEIYGRVQEIIKMFGGPGVDLPLLPVVVYFSHCARGSIWKLFCELHELTLLAYTSDFEDQMLQLKHLRALVATILRKRIEKKPTIEQDEMGLFDTSKECYMRDVQVVGRIFNEIQTFSKKRNHVEPLLDPRERTVCSFIDPFVRFVNYGDVINGEFNGTVDRPTIVRSRIDKPTFDAEEGEEMEDRLGSVTADEVRDCQKWLHSMNQRYGHMTIYGLPGGRAALSAAAKSSPQQIFHEPKVAHDVSETALNLGSSQPTSHNLLSNDHSNFTSSLPTLAPIQEFPQNITVPILSSLQRNTNHGPPHGDQLNQQSLHFAPTSAHECERPLAVPQNSRLSNSHFTPHYDSNSNSNAHSEDPITAHHPYFHLPPAPTLSSTLGGDAPQHSSHYRQHMDHEWHDRAAPFGSSIPIVSKASDSASRGFHTTPMVRNEVKQDLGYNRFQPQDSGSAFRPAPTLHDSFSQYHRPEDYRPPPPPPEPHQFYARQRHSEAPPTARKDGYYNPSMSPENRRGIQPLSRFTNQEPEAFSYNQQYAQNSGSYGPNHQSTAEVSDHQSWRMPEAREQIHSQHGLVPTVGHLYPSAPQSPLTQYNRPGLPPQLGAYEQSQQYAAANEQHSRKSFPPAQGYRNYKKSQPQYRHDGR